MILQEIIRNIVLYNGLIEPWLQSVKESLFTHKNDIVPLEANSFNRTTLFPLIDVTGTRTITEKKFTSLRFFKEEKIDMTKDSASNGNRIITMLMNENAVGLGKSIFFTSALSLNISRDQIVSESLSTTGSFIENTQLHFSHETHEKREYLGEFSLTHEENLFNSFIERR